MKHKLLLPLALIFALLLACVPALAAVPSPTEDFYVLDQANVLSDEVEGTIVLNNDALYEACGAQIVVVTVDTTGSTELEDYAYELFNSWNIGSSKEGNGVLVLLVIRDDTYYVMQGKGLENTLSSGALATLNNTYLEPYFAKKDYDTGVASLFSQLFSRIAARYNLDLTVDTSLYSSYIASELAGQPAYGGEKSSGGVSFLTIFIIVVIAMILLHLIFRRRRPQAYQPMNGYTTTTTTTYTTPVRPANTQRSFLSGFMGGFAAGRATSRPVRPTPPPPSQPIRPTPPPPPRSGYTRPAAPRSSGFTRPSSSSSFGSLFGGSSRSSSSSSRTRSSGGFGGGRSGGGGSSRGGGAGRGR